MKNGRYENMQSGFVADSIEMTAILKDRHFTLDQFSANDGGEGKINANADIIINPDFSYTARAGLMLESAELVRQPELQLRASTDLSFEKSLDKTSLSGDITVENASIGAVEQGGVAIAELDVTEINDEGTLQAQKKQEDALGPIKLDLNLVVPNQLFVTSYGLDSEWGADLKNSGTSEEPIIGGTANLIRGFFEFSGKRFELKRGNFAFQNDKSNDPVIEIAAEHAMLEMTANLRIFGKASNPKLELSSTPYLPENEVLSRILFGTSVAELTAVEAVQLASAVYSLSNGGGQGILGGIRRANGVDRLSIDNDNGREYCTTITGGKYLTNNVYVEVSTAPATGETATSVEIDLTRNLSLVTRRTMDNDNNLSVRWFWDY
ncbi:MAG: translocation/assembly module TamB domain-containing protein [Emcibacteraceae bacterium]|nr:translocation/assembly module TamB domain-containing protein [Emcibacteraceae bacterium]